MPAFLARRYDEPITVERRDDAPTAFVWRNRGYVVRTVLDHWWETGPWWRGGDGADDERELWRVEARAASRSPIVVELRFAWSSGVWTVSSILD